MFVEKHDLGTVSGIDIQTLDQTYATKVGGVNLDLEGAIQRGSNNGLDQRGWAWHAEASRPVLRDTSLKVEGNAASGGKNGTTNFTFDNLYPSNHDLYGLADLVGWKNMNDVAVKLENKSISGVTFLAEAHAFTLRDASAAWYNAYGAVNKGATGNLVDPTGASGRDLGKEFDLSAKYSFKSNATLTAGIAVFQAGRFVDAVSGQKSQLTFGFIQFNKKF
jgi:hypothetical protein